MQGYRSSSFSSTASNTPYSTSVEETPTAIPPAVYRVHRRGAQTRYSFGEGFRSKNQTTIINQQTPLTNFSLAHLLHQSNISSPMISVYDSYAQAEWCARYFAAKYGEDISIMEIDTRHLARGPVFRAADLLQGREDLMSSEERALHRGEYLIMYRIPAQAIRHETPVDRGRKTIGVIGSR